MALLSTWTKDEKASVELAHPNSLKFPIVDGLVAVAAALVAVAAW